MNRLTMVKVISRLRGQPFAVLLIRVADDVSGGDGEHLADVPGAQIPSRERVSRLNKAAVYAERSGRKRPRRLRMDIHVPETPGPHPLVTYLPGGGFVMAQFRMGRAAWVRR